MAERLRAAGVSVEFTKLEGMQHELRADELAALGAWIAQRFADAEGA
jgi:acetyl esterase/lipase